MTDLTPVRALDETSGRSAITGHAALAALFLPRTLPGRLAALGVASLIACSIAPPRLTAWCIFASIMLLCVAFARVPRGKKLKALGWSVAMIAVFTAVSFAAAFVAWLADNGGPGAPVLNTAHYGNAVLTGLLVLLVLVMWLLLGVPRQANVIRLDKDGKGSAQQLIVGLVTAAACAATVCLILLLHFGGETLRRVPLSQLAAASIFTVVVIAPYYKKLAHASWRHGVPGFLKVSKYEDKPWRAAIDEVRAAVTRTRETQAVLVKAVGSANEAAGPNLKSSSPPGCATSRTGS